MITHSPPITGNEAILITGLISVAIVVMVHYIMRGVAWLNDKWAKALDLRRGVTCPTCLGCGSYSSPYHGRIECSPCNGSGEIERPAKNGQ